MGYDIGVHRGNRPRIAHANESVLVLIRRVRVDAEGTTDHRLQIRSGLARSRVIVKTRLRLRSEVMHESHLGGR